MIKLNKCVSLSFLVLLLNLGCKEKKSIPGFDHNAWKSHKLGCEGNRSAVVNDILDNKKTWQGLDDDDIVELLGAPERSYYYERNVRAFGYYLHPGKQCDSKLAGFGSRLIVEFNATGFSKRIFLEKD